MKQDKPSRTSSLRGALQAEIIPFADSPEGLTILDYQGKSFAHVTEEGDALTVRRGDHTFSSSKVEEVRRDIASLLKTHAAPRARHLNFMIDIETLGTAKDSVVWSIGIAPFSIEEGELSIGLGMRILIDPRDSMKHSAEIDPETVGWWLKRTPEAQAAYHQALEEGIAERGAITLLRKYMTAWGGDYPERWQPWGNSSLFDMGLIQNMCERHEQDHPWHFMRPRCYRTVTQLAQANGWDARTVQTSGVHHDALDDAITQIHKLHSAMTHLSGHGLKNLYTKSRAERRGRTEQIDAPDEPLPKTKKKRVPESAQTNWDVHLRDMHARLLGTEQHYAREMGEFLSGTDTELRDRQQRMITRWTELYASWVREVRAAQTALPGHTFGYPEG